MAMLPLLGESAHPHVHIAFCTLLHRNPPMSLKVEFIPRKGQTVCTKIRLIGCGSTKNKLSTPKSRIGQAHCGRSLLAEHDEPMRKELTGKDGRDLLCSVDSKS